MGLFKKHLTTIVVIYICLSFYCISSQRTDEDRARARKATKCTAQCGGKEKLFNPDESWICCDPEPNRNYYRMNLNCIRECQGASICNNTLECLCEACKKPEGPGSEAHSGFCSERGQFHVLKKECEELVCTGKVPFRGWKNCKENPDEPKRFQK